MFAECVTEVEKNAYKRTGDLKREFAQKNHDENYEFYKLQRIGSYNEVFHAICSQINIPEESGRFIYFIDPQYLFDTTRGYRFENITVNYGKLLESGLEGLKYEKDQLTNQFCRDYNKTIDAMELLVDRIYESARGKSYADYFCHMKTEKPSSMAEAMQRILFVNQLFWQMGHRLIGLGRLDVMLYPFYEKDIREKRYTKEEAVILIKDFLEVLHQYYWLKSNVLMGDTGQIIILGGVQEDGSYFCNDLTEFFIMAVKQLQFPDPKLLLRVSTQMPRKLMEQALDCIETGIGSPLLSNDDVVIPCLWEYGIEMEDACDYGTSACWEPLIQGKSASLNNLAYLSYPKVFQKALEQTPESFLKNEEDLLRAFYVQLKTEISRVCISLSDFRFQYNPLLSVFTSDCFENKRDISAGGARYSHCGITTVGLSNVVNSILNIREFVFRRKEYSIQQIRNILDQDYFEQDELKFKLKYAEKYYGKDDEDILELTNEIICFTTKYTENYRNYMGGRMKFGISAPHYIDAAKEFPATFDGRGKGEAFGMHISSEKSNGYSEIINFASLLDYGKNRFNGNVVDFMVSPHFISQNFDKFVDFLMLSIEVGFFQLQMNVVSSKKLIDAKAHPEKYPNLIVRVWGFSAYFSELPESYQNVLIQRALENERKAS